MQNLVRILRALILDEPEDGMLKRYAKNAFILCPPLVSIFTLAFGGTLRFGTRFLYGMIIATTVSGTCHLFVYGIMYIQKMGAKWKGLPAPGHPSSGRTALYSFTAMFPGTYLGYVFASYIFSKEIKWRFLENIGEYSSGILIGSIIMGIVILAELHRDSEKAEKDALLRLAEMEKKRLQAEISALTAQMNPHLLFNALNTIASMIPSAPERAEEMTVLLSDLYRGVLGASKQSKHSLAEELEICRNYLAVEQARFGSRLTVEFDVQATHEIQIPALTLQPFVENAIKHGLASRSSGGKISVIAKESRGTLELRVEDDGVGLGNSPAKTGAGTAIENFRERMRLHYGEKGSVFISPRPAGGTVVKVDLPMGDV